MKVTGTQEDLRVELNLVYNRFPGSNIFVLFSYHDYKLSCMMVFSEKEKLHVL